MIEEETTYRIHRERTWESISANLVWEEGKWSSLIRIPIHSFSILPHFESVLSLNLILISGVPQIYTVTVIIGKNVSLISVSHCQCKVKIAT